MKVLLGAILLLLVGCSAPMESGPGGILLLGNSGIPLLGDDRGW
jgi:hypothetical protein